MARTVWDVVEVRWLAVRDVVDGGLSLREAADRHRMSSSTLGRWVTAYRAGGMEALAPRSTRPRASPGRTPDLVEAAVVDLYRDKGGRWGPKKIRAHLLGQGWDAPAVSTVAQVLRRHGLTAPVRSRPVRPDPGRRFERSVSNELWQIDGTMHQFKGRGAFWVVDIIDDHSRYLTGALAGPAQTGDLAWRTVQAAAAAHGLPLQLLSDNGMTFTGRLILGTTVRFERQVAAAGIRLIHGRPYHPQTQGKIERQHQTQNQWFADNRPRSLPEAQEMLDAYRHEYNTVRPHEGINQVTPASRYVPGAGVDLPTLETAPADEYPPGAVLRHVSPGGRFRYDSEKFTLDARWTGSTVGLVHVGPVLRVYYGHSQITTFAVPHLKVNTRQSKTSRQ